jgi:hypothetical protein
MKYYNKILPEGKYFNDLNDINIKDKVIGFIAGCYCPPHKGHLKTWIQACVDLNLDILFITTLTNYFKTKQFYSRHGIPIEFTEWVVSNWYKELKNRDGKQVTVVFSNDIPYTSIGDKFKQLYLISGYEGDSPDFPEELIENLNNTSKWDLSEPDVNYWGRKTPARDYKITNKRNNPVGDNTYPIWKISNKSYWRNTSDKSPMNPSATKFSKCLKTAKTNLLKGIDTRKECFIFLPDFMKDKEKYEYIDKIMLEYYTENSLSECREFFIKKKYDEEEIEKRCGKFKFSYNGGKKNKKTKSK